MKVSFDFDNTLQNPAIQKIAKSLLQDDENNVCVVTSRWKVRDNQDLFAVAEAIGIDKENIFFTNGKDKDNIIEQQGIEVHFEDCPFECEMLRSVCTVIQVEPFILDEE